MAACSDVPSRAATLSDSPAIASLMTQLGYPSTPLEIERRLERLLSSPDYQTIVAEAPGEPGKIVEVVGLVLLHLEYGLEYDAAYGRVMGLVIHEGWRGRGLGRQLMQYAERWCGERGADRIVLTSASRRADAHKFYDAIGYETTGVRFAKALKAVKAKT